MLRILRGLLVMTLAIAGCAPAISPAPTAPREPTAPPAPSEAAPAPTGTEPAPSVDPPGVGDLGETRYSCGEPSSFLPALLDEPANAELEDHPSAAALRAAIAEVGPDIDLLPESGYWLVYRDELDAYYLARAPAGTDPEFADARIEFEGGVWKLGGWGQCRPRIVLDGLSLAAWVLDPEAPPPDATATTFTALVTEWSCTGGKPMGGRLQPPSITYGRESVLVVFAARPLEGGDFDCPGNPSTRAVVQLREPLGERRLLDAGVFPPAEPVAPES
jgi:hypothetical protein